jgi:hypothetical protein
MLVLSFLIVSHITAQKIKIGIVAGPVMTSTNKSSNSFTNTNDSTRDRTNTVRNNFSFFGGVVAAIPVSKNIIFKPQLQYIAKGWTINHDFETREDYETKLVSQWIELPLNFVYTVPAKNGRFFFGLGPYVSCALAAKIHDDRESGAREIEFQKGDLTDTIPSANRIDVGANFIAEYEFRNGFFISLNYSRGFVDFRNDLDDTRNPQNKNMVVGLGIGYMFK